jgi:riboflavin biosynthesis pyrimidine reductase
VRDGIAGEQIIGISKLTRLVRLFARRFTVQERLGEQIADALVTLIQPRGVAVHLSASHLCTQMRGVEEHSRTVTTFWRGALSGLGLPDDLRRRYDGDIGFDGPRQRGRPVMALLRACADVVLIGSGTLQASPRGRWTPDGAFPAAAAALEELRLRLGKPTLPELAVVTGSGMIDPAHPAFERGAVVLTTEGGAQSLEGRLPAASRAVSLGPGPLVDLGRALEHLRAEGHELVLAEAGPHVLGSLLADRLVDELFLTVSPLLAGRAEGETRFGLVEGKVLLPDLTAGARLLGVRRSGGHLFLRYALTRS